MCSKNVDFERGASSGLLLSALDSIQTVLSMAASQEDGPKLMKLDFCGLVEVYEKLADIAIGQLDEKTNSMEVK